jgi:hypothetical protein
MVIGDFLSGVGVVVARNLAKVPAGVRIPHTAPSFVSLAQPGQSVRLLSEMSKVQILEDTPSFEEVL